MDYLKFIGKQKDLKPLGFKFGKYYASNYIGYNLPISDYSNYCMIWMKGKDVSFLRFDTTVSAHVYNYIKAGERGYEKTYSFNGKKYHNFVYNSITKKYENYDSDIHHFGIHFINIFKDHKDGDEFTPEQKKEMDEFQEKYTEYFFSEDDYDILEVLINENIFEVSTYEVEDED